MRRPAIFALLFAAISIRPAVALAHHEAIFGPQSSLVLSADHFVSAQVFSRALGSASDNNRSEETTSVISAGARIAKSPVTFTAIIPYTWVSNIDSGAQASHSGFENAILGLRYKYDLSDLQKKWDRDGNFIMGVGAIEVPNGVIDHPAWQGSPDGIGALLGSLEKGRWSGLAYVFGKYNGLYNGEKKGDSLFLGNGIAYTPNEDMKTGKLISYQLGFSFEQTFMDRLDGQAVSDTGGNQALFHPTLVYSPGHGLLFFGVVSVPVYHNFRDTTQQDRFRLGSGVIYAW